MFKAPKVPGPDPELVALQKSDAARAQAQRVDAMQSVLSGLTGRTRRRFGVFDLTQNNGTPTVPGSAPPPSATNGYSAPFQGNAGGIGGVASGQTFSGIL